MKISCPNCSAAYELDDSRVPPAGLSIKCPRCKNPFTVQRARAEGAARPVAAQGAVPLPGQNGAKPAAGAKPPAGRPPGARKPSAPGAIPLPGMGQAAAAPSAKIPAGAVPLPGLDIAAAAKPASRPPAPAQSAPPPDLAGAVPLPGFAGMQKRTPGSPADDPFAAIDLGAESAPPPPPPTDVDDLELPDPMPRPGAAPSSDPDAFAVAPKEAKPKAKAAPAEDTSFDFVDAPAPRQSQPAPAAPLGEPAPDLLDFVDEAPRAEKKGKRPPPPTIGRSESGPEETLSLDDAPPAKEPAGARKLDDKQRKKREREERAARDRADRVRRKTQRASGGSSGALQALGALVTPKRVIGAALAVALAAVVVLGLHARTTPAGLFWMNRYLPSKKAASAAETKVIERGLARLGQGDFTGAREAVAAAAQLLQTVPDDEEVKAFFVLAASEMKLEYGQVGGDWDQARRVVEKMKGTRPAQNRARAAYALASGDVPAGKQILATLGDAQGADPESTWLYAQALILSGEGARASQLLDGVLKTRPAPRLRLLRGNVARDRGQLPEAAGFYQKILQASPESARAMVELADVRLRLGDGKGASELLARALDTDRRKTLDAGEEARANVMRGRLLAAAHDVKGAEAAFEHAVMLDPGSAAAHEAYGDFRIRQREWEKASRQFESAIQHGGGASAYAGAARAFLGQNRLLEADKAITEAVTREAGNARFLYLQGRVADAIGKAEEAYRKYEAALKAKPDLVEALAAEGVVWMSRNDKAKAQERLDAAMAVKPEGLSVPEDEAIGDLALAMGEPKKAQEAFTRALEKD
ncbi:MAG TPA: tetratricopeptide repeat protein, partial [Myxococcales bacterium]